MAVVLDTVVSDHAWDRWPEGGVVGPGSFILRLRLLRCGLLGAGERRFKDDLIVGRRDALGRSRERDAGQGMEMQR